MVEKLNSWFCYLQIQHNFVFSYIYDFVGVNGVGILIEKWYLKFIKKTKYVMKLYTFLGVIKIGELN